MGKTHTQHLNFQCKICAKKFFTESLLKSHVKRSHGNPVQCAVCGKGFSDKFNLKKHSALHTGIKPHTCHHCGKSFSQKCHLKRHINNVHENISHKSVS